MAEPLPPTYQDARQDSPFHFRAALGVIYKLIIPHYERKTGIVPILSDTHSTTGGGTVQILGLFDWYHGDLAEEHGVSQEHSLPSLPYRADLLANEHVDLKLVSSASSRIHVKLRDVVEHRSGLKVDRFVRGIRAAAGSSAVLAFLEDKLYAPSWARRHNLWPYAGTPLIGISCWWAEELQSGKLAAEEVRRVMDGVDRLFVFSQNQERIFEEAGVPAHKVRSVPFGVDQRFYTPSTEPKRFQVLAAGVDRGRDWPTLMAAATLLPEIRFDLFTQPQVAARLNAPSNVTVHEPVTIHQHRNNLQAAELVVVPTFDLAYPTGQSVMLEGMSSGTCTAVTHTDAMSEYIDDGRWNLSMPMGDPEGVAHVIRSAIDDSRLRERVAAGGREAVEKTFNFDSMWHTIRDEILAVL